MRGIAMHLVEVRGGRKGQRELVEMIVYPLIKHLMPRLRNIEIDIKLVKNLYKKTGAEGFCLQDEPRRYELEIDTAWDSVTSSRLYVMRWFTLNKACVGNSRKSVVNNTGKVNFATKTTMSNLGKRRRIVSKTNWHNGLGRTCCDTHRTRSGNCMDGEGLD